MSKDKNNFGEQLFVVKVIRDYEEHDIFEGDILIVDESKMDTNLLCIEESSRTARVISRNNRMEHHFVIGGVVERIRNYRNAVCDEVAL